MAARSAIGLVVAAALLAAAGCASTLPPAGTVIEDHEPPRQTLGSALIQCTIDNEYAPADAVGLADDALGEGELEWRDCAYAVLERVLKPTLNEPQALDDLIADDRRLTALIASGGGTRSQRNAAIGARIDVMETHEGVLRDEEMQELGAAELLEAMDSQSDPRGVGPDLVRVRSALGQPEEP